MLRNAQLVLREAIIEANLSPVINDTAPFAEKLSIRSCEATSKQQFKCQAVVAGFTMWNVSFLYT